MPEPSQASGHGVPPGREDGDTWDRQSWIPPPAVMPLAEENCQVLEGPHGTTALGHAARAAAPQGFGNTWGCWDLSLFLKARGWERPVVNVARSGKAHQSSWEPWQRPKPNAGLGDGSMQGHSPVAPSLSGARSPPCTHTSGRDWPSLQAR